MTDVDESLRLCRRAAVEVRARVEREREPDGWIDTADDGWARAAEDRVRTVEFVMNHCDWTKAETTFFLRSLASAARRDLEALGVGDE